MIELTLILLSFFITKIIQRAFCNRVFTIRLIQRAYFFQADIDEEYREYKEFSGVFAEGIVKGNKKVI